MAVIIATALTALYTRRPKESISIALWASVGIALTCILTAFLSDYSFDGNFYHQEGIVLLSDGWNPVYTRVGLTNTIWVEHYAKFLEITEAALLSLTGNIESAKAINVILFAGAAFFLTGTLRTLFPALSPRRLTLCVFVLMANPVCLSQIFTFYNDYALYLELLIITCSFGLILKEERTDIAWTIAALVTIIALNTKFTHGFYVGLAWFVMLLCSLSAKKYRLVRTTVLLGLGALLVGVFVTGYNPYITNTLYYGNPLYPLLGESTVDIMSTNTPPLYEGNSRLTNLLLSLSTNGIDIIGGATDSHALKKIFLNFARTSYDSRVNGFGPLFIICLAASLLYALFFIRKAWIWLLILLIIGATFIFDQCWWARYVPFLWAVPGLVILGSCIYPVDKVKSRIRTVYITLCTSLIVISSLVVLGRSVGSSAATTIYRHNLFEALRSSSLPVRTTEMLPQQRMIFEKAGISTQTMPLDSLDLSRSVTYYGQWDPKNKFLFIELPAEHFQELTDTTTLVSRILYLKMTQPHSVSESENRRLKFGL